MLFDRVEQTTTTTGTGTLSLIAPTDASRRSFVQAAGSGALVYYCIETIDGTQYEEGYGTVTAGTPDVLTRTVVVLSSNSNAPVNFPSGTKRVFSMLPAAMASRIVGMQSFTDSGSSTTSTSYVTLNASTFYYTPKSASSTLELICTMQGYMGTVTGANTRAAFTLAEGSTAIGVGLTISAFAGSGGVGIEAPVTLRATAANTSTAQRAFNLRGANSGGGVGTVTASAINLLIIERTA